LGHPPGCGTPALPPPPRCAEDPTLGRLLLLTTFVVLLGGAIFLVTWEIPAPTVKVETVIPDDRLPR
jgi:hypothetical protein